jgi:hypothetical protein
LQGDGVHPPADACDFARFCSALDFWSITDHAEGLTEAHWKETKDSIRQCNALAGDAANPDVVAYLGWEWTQIGQTRETHYGHKNVIFPGLEEEELPKRPISSLSIASSGETPPPRFLLRGAAAVGRLLGYDAYADLIALMGDVSGMPECPADKNTRDLPAACREWAETPAELFRKLDEWGFETLVIPHGLAWGIHAPPGARLDVQLSRAQHDPAKQRLLEVMSGHGNSEEYRGSAELPVDEKGDLVCPAPTKDYLPCCWQAGEIMRARCGPSKKGNSVPLLHAAEPRGASSPGSLALGRALRARSSEPGGNPLPADECERRVVEARRLALEAGVSPDQVFPDTRGEDWLDCDQCRDCFKPSMTLRPGETAQYGAALSRIDERDPDTRKPLRFRWGFIASTDNHAARPGTGYKQYARRTMTDTRGFADEASEARVRGWLGSRQEDPKQPQAVKPRRLFELIDVERKTSFLYPGGIVAAHATGRDRRSIWQALVRREVYGTSGPRILLWFDLENAPDGPMPMGSEVAMTETPRFVVRAAGDFEQKPGCPAEAAQGLSPERLRSLCRDECYHPSDRRRPITAIEVVRIRPRQRADEPIAPLIEDPWRRFPCPPNPEGCRIEFEDPEFAEARRDTVYYVRALEGAAPAINAAGLRTKRDAEGNAVAVDPCKGGHGTPASDDCFAPAEERAWSSPIYVDYQTSGGPSDEGT